ncbi:MAG: hypothetical protein Q7I97_06960 [Thermovirgaceae bacterium]|nr:hypothetical protein [Thermovirgaceae bacterium]
MKQQIVSEISSKLSELKIPVQTGNGADLTINTDFLDAGWSTGSKKISYEASVFVNEQDNVVYMYEKTVEVGKGFSFGSSSGTTFQSGKTLFRKVKSVQYGPDGKAYEYSLDLGAIPKAAKETAKKYGWKFKTVLSKGKAMYPDGYSAASVPSANMADPVVHAGAALQEPSVAPPEAPLQPQYSDPQKPFYSEAKQKSERKGSKFGFIGFMILGVLMALILMAGKATVTGWAISAVTFAAAFFIQRKISKKGFLLNLVLWLVTGFVLLMLSTAFTTQEVNMTTARLKNAQMTTAVDSAGKPQDKVGSYQTDTPQLVVSAELRSAPTNTKVRFVWKYLTSDILITEFPMNSGNNEPDIYVFNYINNQGRPWPQGEYRVEMFIEDREKPDATVDFEVN